MYCSWNVDHDRQIVLSFWTVFCPFIPPTPKIKQPKIPKFWKNKKQLKILSFYTRIPKSTIIWYMVPEKSNTTEFFVILTIFCLFTPYKPEKSKFWKKWKTCLEISFYTSVPKIKIICYIAPDIWHLTDVINIFHFGLFFALLTPPSSLHNSPNNKHFGCNFSSWANFCPLTPLTARKMKIKNPQNAWRYSHFTQL